MTTIKEQKKKLEQKKARMLLEETKLKLKERKMRTRSLIERGGLITKAGLDHLPTNALYGALLSLKNQLGSHNGSLLSNWTAIGKTAFDEESAKTTPVILKFDDQPDSDIPSLIRSHGLRFNRFRQEWYGNVAKIDELKNALGKIKYNLEIIDIVN